MKDHCVINEVVLLYLVIPYSLPYSKYVNSGSIRGNRGLVLYNIQPVVRSNSYDSLWIINPFLANITRSRHVWIEHIQ